jgi:heterodisulfide reductase subunit A-like polyferredoxin
MPSKYDMGLTNRKATYKPYAQAIPGSFAIEKLDTAPCRVACPANLNVQGYVAMVKMGKYREAVKIIMEDLPFPGILGRICPHRCEKSCRRLELDEAISIRELKRVAADHVDLRELPVPDITPRSEKVAIIGSGPAGLTAAYFLAMDGYQVGVYESMPEAGGMMRYGIPEHRLPRSVLDAEIENLKRYGIEIHTNITIGKDLTLEALREHGADAIFLAIGAWKGLKLRIPGEETLHGVSDVTTFLREVHLGNLKKLDGKVVVIGGGHSALDAARVALRMGAGEAHILYRRSRTEMLAEPEEVEETEKEGVKIHFLTAPSGISSENDHVTGIECIRTRLSEMDTTGRRKPIPIEGSEFFIEADHIIPAIGQEPDYGDLINEKDLNVSKWGLLEVNPETLQTNIPEIFAGGDVISGPATVIEAVEAGQRVAKYIGQYLQGEELPSKWHEAPPMGTNWTVPSKDEPVRSRLEIPTLPPEKRLSGFEEVNLPVEEKSARQEADRCLDCGSCCECFQCVSVCDAKAVTLETHAQRKETTTLNVGSVVLSPGFTPFDPSKFASYNYAKHPNIITSTEFERILSATGPFMGHLVRISDKKEPKKIAWFQCIGSRDLNRCDNAYCSSVCCMYAVKEAVIAKEHANDDLDCAIFFMDMRTPGKDFEKYYNDARDKHGVRFIRSRVHTIDPVAGTDDLEVRYVTESGDLKTEIFDMIVLSVGMEISPEIADLAETLGIELTEGNFCKTDTFGPVATSREGIFVCGAFQGPKDIPQSVVDSSAAAAAAGEILAPARNTLARSKEAIPEIDVVNERPRIGIFVCRCGINIAGVIDVPSVATYAATLPYVEFATDNLFSCSQDTQETISRIIKEKNLNRVVVAACTPKTHEPLFQETLINAGLNKYLFEMCNIRNQDSWVHKNNPDLATKKAKDLLQMAVSKVSLLEPLKEVKLEVNQTAMVVGGGISGMAAARSLARQGYETHVIEKSEKLGGQALNIYRTNEGEDVQEKLGELIADIEKDDNVHVHLNTTMTNMEGFVGNFRSRLNTRRDRWIIDHGVAILATGASSLNPTEYGYGKDPRILTSLELDRKFIKKDPTLKTLNSVVFIQCVGSREPERPYCSRVCCTHSVKNALELKELNPDMNVFILYRDIRTYGQRELLYKKAREAGVIFIRYVPENKPEVSLEGGKLQVRVADHILGRPLAIDSDLLILASAILPNRDETLAAFFKVPLNDDGFFVERHAKLGPSEFATDGVFLCGMAHYPKPMDESIAQGQAAASRAVTLLSRENIFMSGTVAMTNPMNCTSCGICVSICPYNAPSYKEEDVPFAGKAEINPVLCKGCGLCVASCRSGAIRLKGFDNDQIFAQIFALDVAG